MINEPIIIFMVSNIANRRASGHRGWRNKMEISKEKLIEFGGNLWEKDRMSRVYLTDDVLVKMGFKIVDVARYSDEFRGLGKAKLYFDCNKNVLISDSEFVRTAMKNNGFKCA